MNAQKHLYVFILIVLGFGGGFFTGVKSCTGTIDRLETDITELSNRNKSITTRIIDLDAAARRDAEASRLLAEGLADISRRIAEQVQRGRAIADRAQRIAFLAGVLDKGITELISKTKNIQGDSN